MNPLMRQMVNYKLNHLSPEELIKWGEKYEIILTKEQAKKIIQILSKEKVDIGNKPQVERLLKHIRASVGKDIEQKMRYLLDSIH